MRGVTVENLGTITTMDISTHTPHARRDNSFEYRRIVRVIFQLTRLMRGVTLSFHSSEWYYTKKVDKKKEK